MKHQYESELIEEIVDTRGHKKSSLHYESECVESWIEEAKGAYPKLCDYESEWIKYISVLDDTGGSEDPKPPIGEFPYIVLSDVTEATVDNVVPYAYKSAILYGKSETIDETLQSVKIPVLTTSGINVFPDDNRMEYGAWASSGGAVSTNSEIRCKNKYTPFPKGLKNGDKMYIVLSDTSINSDTNMHVYDENKKYVSPSIRGCTVSNFVNGVAVVSINDITNCSYFSFRAKSSNINCEFALMINDYAPYEPFKSNILTVNENVVLRGIGDVKDELDLLTGELTERIGEVVLDENSAKNFKLSVVGNNSVSFWCTHNASSPFVNISKGEDLKALLCDKIPRKSNFNEDAELIHSGTGAVVLRILKNKLQTPDVNGLTQYLQSNPLTVQYQLASESVRTVDLNIQDQNGKTLSVIKPIEGKMLLSTSSDTIKPLFSGEIPVEAITQNLASFIDLD